MKGDIIVNNKLKMQHFLVTQQSQDKDAKTFLWNNQKIHLSQTTSEDVLDIPKDWIIEDSKQAFTCYFQCGKDMNNNQEFRKTVIAEVAKQCFDRDQQLQDKMPGPQVLSANSEGTQEKKGLSPLAILIIKIVTMVTIITLITIALVNLSIVFIGAPIVLFQSINKAYQEYQEALKAEKAEVATQDIVILDNDQPVIQNYQDFTANNAAAPNTVSTIGVVN
jgi:hypothetical protein